MLPLKNALQDHDLIVLRVIGEWWELDLTGSNKAACVKELAKVLPQLDLADEIGALAPEEAAALQALLANGGRLPVATFVRQFGDVRMMGPAALERDEPWYEPENAAEAIWYKGLLYKGFAEVDGVPKEYFYLPNELMAQFPAPVQETAVSPKTSTPSPKSTAVAALPPAPPPSDITAAATTDAVDDMTTLLALAQRGQLHEGQAKALRPYLYHPNLSRLAMLTTIGLEMGLLRETAEGYRPARTAVEWLQKSREAQLRALVEGWRTSAWNELRHTPHLVCEGSGWQNDPTAARAALLEVLTPSETWFATADVLAHIKQTNPDFQRPNGNYDTWYIRDEEMGDYVTGFENWAAVEGRLLAFLVQGPLHWLGLTDLSNSLYRLTPRAVAWLTHQPIRDNDVAVPILVHPDATMLVPFNADRYQRFQVARIAEPLPVEVGKPFGYRLTPRSLAEAHAQGINAERVVEFLQKVSTRPLPPSTKRAIERWASNGTEARIEQGVILRVKEPEILEKLRQHAKTRPFLGESIGDLAAIVPTSHWPELCAQAAQLGLLLEVEM
ncbi:MAG: helicase-associated domain-containing protein [Chloroflexi bacterium]|nr:helicase-associated domain-containing protein [Chloroflexota bacterium]